MPQSNPSYLQQLRGTHTKHGHVVLAVMQGADTYSFAYTVGLAAQGGRDLLVIGLPQDVSHPVLNALARRLKGLATLPAVVDDAANVPVRLREVPTAKLHQPPAGFPMLRLPVPDTLVLVEWPCRAGFWPGTPGYTSLCRQDPTDLSLPTRQ